MLIVEHPKDLSDLLSSFRAQNKKIGFFPTMGALHQGHLSLLEASKAENDVTVCSIFVNPTQFNNPEDLEKYPRTPEQDQTLLNERGCDILFMPTREVLYENENPFQLNYNGLDRRFEGASRPGHFDGVARVVKLLFEAVQPDNAYFGLKDFQQCMVIQLLVEQLAIPVNLHFCPTLREADGLAMSSRNLRLSEALREQAPVIYNALEWAKEKYVLMDLSEIQYHCISLIESQADLKVDYFEIAEARTLLPAQASTAAEDAVALTAVFAQDVRLIDNLLMK
ncbi:MAG: pantoate--beta-alanine ligase [Bacteroidota bacterium]|nr:pantoate--beta-alanine ligase [Bacteroidota bacterium]MDX5429564.1 pantoate--beta-alanine ligase [Bacteroidota bacterium]MDX5468351.1 pantoate--beta-alanine ligase [Bacteroidota bacterium]